MAPNDNYKEYLEYVKNNMEKLLEGKEIEYECPFCSRIEKIKLITVERAKCLTCGNEFKAKIRLQID